MVAAIFEALTSALTAFINTLNSGVTAITALFWTQADGLTVLGTLSVIVVAVSLTYFLLRLLFGLIRMRG